MVGFPISLYLRILAAGGRSMRKSEWPTRANIPTKKVMNLEIECRKRPSRREVALPNDVWTNQEKKDCRIDGCRSRDVY